MSFYEGKNIFRNVSAQQAVYSGSSNIAAGKIKLPSPTESTTTTTTEVEVVLVAHGNVLNLMHRESGQLLLAKEVGLDDDVILNIDCIVLPRPDQRQAAPSTSTSTNKTKTGGEEEQEEDRDPALMYVACSTRSLQIYVFALKISPESKKKLARNNKKNNSGEDFIPFANVEHQLDLFSWTVVKSWTADQSAVSSLKFSPATYHLASGSADGGLKVWSVLNHFLTHQFRGHGGVVTTLTFLQPDESLLAAGTFEGYISVIDFSAKKVLASGQKHTASVEALSLVTKSTDDEGAVLLISASRDRNITVFEAKSLNQLRTVALGHPLLACSFPSPFVGVYACENGLLGAFSVSPHTYGVVVFAVRGAPTTGTEEEHSVRSIAYLPATATITTNAETTTTSEEKEDEKPGDDSAATAGSKTKAKKSAAAAKKKAGARRPRSQQEEEPEEQDQADDEKKKAGAVATASSSSSASSSYSSHSLLPETLLIVDASYRLFSFTAKVAPTVNPDNGGTLSAPVGANFNCEQTDILNFDQVMDLKFLPRVTTTTTMISPTRDASQKQQQQQQQHSDHLSNRELVIATNARDCYVTKAVGSSRLRGTLQGHSDIVVSVDVTSDGSQIITASKDMHCRVWDTKSLKCVGVSRDGVHSAELTGVKFVPCSSSSSSGDAMHLACTIGFDSVLAIWDLRETAMTTHQKRLLESGDSTSAATPVVDISCSSPNLFCKTVLSAFSL